MHKKKLIQTFFIFYYIISSASLFAGCSYNERLKEFGAVAGTQNIGRSSLSVTLVTNESKITIPPFSHGAATLTYSIEDSVVKGVRDILDKTYARVEVSSGSSKGNELFATLKVDVGAPSSAIRNDVTRGLYSTASLDLFEGSTGRLLASYKTSKSSEYYRPGALNGYLIITLLSGFALTPITMPLAVDVAGKYVSTVLDENLKFLLSDLDNKIREGEIRNPLENEIRGELKVEKLNFGSGIESLLNK